MKNSKELQSLIDDIQSKGRYGDTILAHINPQEANLLKSLGGSGTINPKTGLPEFWGWKSVTKAIRNIGSSIDDAVISPVVSTVKDAGSSIDDAVINPVATTIGDAGESFEDEFDAAMENPVLKAAAVAATTVFFGPVAGAAVNGAITYKQTGDLEESAKAAAITYAAAQASGAGGAGGTEAGAPELLGEAGGNTFALEAGAEGVIPLGDAAAGSAAASGGSAYAADNIDVGGGYNPATGTGDAATAGAAAAIPPVYEPPVVPPTVSDITDAIKADPNAPDNIDAGGGWSPAAGATPAELTAARAAMIEKGLTFKDALNYVRGGLLINSLTGDPLGLGGDTGGGGGGGGFTGFELVPIPSDWRSPTYAASSAPIDLNSIFTDQNLLGGTQWQGLPQQQNVSFNDIFASGQQRTPMGQPVDINQIVSAILGQNTASQKSA